MFNLIRLPVFLEFVRSYTLKLLESLIKVAIPVGIAYRIGNFCYSHISGGEQYFCLMYPYLSEVLIKGCAKVPFEYSAEMTHRYIHYPSRNEGYITFRRGYADSGYLLYRRADTRSCRLPKCKQLG